MRGFEEHKPTMAMVGLQFCYAAVILSARAALLEGLNPAVFVFYRLAIATSVVAPIAYLSTSGNPSGSCMTLKSFCLIFLTSLIGVSVHQNIYFLGMYFASSSMASAMGNLLPAVTFVMATVFGLERLSFRSWSSLAKIIGTVFSVVGAVSMAMLRGPKLLNLQLQQLHNFLFGFSSSGSENWLLGCLLLFASSCCWSLWLILQVPISASYPDHLSLTAWLCFLGALQAGLIALFSEKDPNAWVLHSNLQLFCCFFTGVIGSGLAFFVQSWCISQRGPLFSAMFSPLPTVIVTILASIFLHEDIYIGSLVGAAAVIMGLYIVLWGKAKDMEETKKQTIPDLQDRASEEESSRVDLEESLLNHKSSL